MEICIAISLSKMKRNKFSRNKVLNLELMRNKLESGIYLDHAINAISACLAENLQEDGFIIFNKAERENGENLPGRTPSTSQSKTIVTIGG